VIDTAIACVTGILHSAIDKIFPDPKQAAEAKVLLAQQDFAPLLAQIQVNLAEASSQHWFAANWRPFIGWVCGFAFFYKFIGQPFLVFCLLIWVPEFPAHKLPVLDWTELAAVLFGMLGLSRDRSKDKAALLSN
jgi:hypothetical protein